MQITLEKLADKLGIPFTGDGRTVLTGAASFHEAGTGDVTFATRQKHFDALADCAASVVIVPPEVDVSSLEVSTIQAENPYHTFARILEIFFQPVVEIEPGVSPRAEIASDARVGKGCSIGPNVFIARGAVIGQNVILYPGVYIGAGVVIGDDTRIYANCSVYHGSVIGRRGIIHSGTVIGSDGYGFTPVAGRHAKIPQVGHVCIGDDVEIGANVTIDRAAIGVTVIGNGCKLDNLIHIAHNVRLGDHCLIVAQVGISGSVEVGQNVTIAGQAGIVGHVRIGSNTTVAARSVVTGDLPDNSFVMGFPAKPHQEEKKIKAALRKLPELLKTVNNIKKCMEMGD